MATQPDTLLLGTANSYQLLPYMDYIEDAGRGLSIDGAVDRFQQGEYQKTTAPVTFNAGITFSAFWFRFSIKNTTPQTRNLVLGIAEKVDTLWLYQQQQGKVQQLAATGFAYSYATRPIGNRNFLFGISIPPNTSITYYLLAKNSADYMYIPFVLKDAGTYLAYETSRYQLLSIYIGFFLFVILFNIFLYGSLRDKLHIWYALYVLVSLVYLMMEDGITYELVLKYTPSLRWLFNEEYWWYGLMVLWLYVMQLVLNQTRANSRFYLLTKMVMAVLCLRILIAFITEIKLVSFSRPLTHVIFNIGDIAFLMGCALLLAGVIEKIIQKSKPAVYYLIAIVFGLAGTLNIYFNYIGLTNINLVEPNAMIVGLAIEIAILSFILTVRYNLLKREKEKLLFEVNAYQKTLLEKILAIEEDERKRLGEDLHDDIGGTVSSLHLYATNYFLKHAAANNEDALYREQLIRQLGNLAVQVRDVAHDLMPKDFESRGIIAVLSEKVDGLNANGKVIFELIHTGDIDSIPRQLQITCYRIIVELVTNIIKHAKASASTIHLNGNEDCFQIIVEDDGIGLDANTKSDGIGLKNVHSRIRYLHGAINIDSNKLGTTVIIEIPLTKNVQ